MAQSNSVEKASDTNAKPNKENKQKSSDNENKPDAMSSTEVPADDVLELPKLDGAIEPSFWDDVRDSLPDWLDEILGFALIVFGGLSFLALFIPSGAVVAVAWADILRQFFWYG